MKFKRQLVKHAPIPRAKLFSIRIQAKILKTFVKQVLPYGLSTAAYSKVNNYSLKIVQNITCRITHGDKCVPKF